MELQIRRRKPEDTRDINRIRREIEPTPSGTESQQIEEYYLVVERQGEVIGYMLSYISSGCFGVEKSAWISMIGVDPKHMGQGIGKQLAAEALAHFKALGIQTVYASVSWDSTDMLSFLKTLGFDRSAFINLKKKLDEGNGAG
ncbi:MAG: GNAT family N-acetyltransferase [Pseudomonadota bacterium]